ncbi:mitochondrial ribosomal protein S2 [Lycorma delicatula]|uniref:mitochondrial ribosomal protein S2 n=1 Tax=Lycorma delicatula TaxID=130591 RepID=UPI003F51449B
MEARLSWLLLRAGLFSKGICLKSYSSKCSYHTLSWYQNMSAQFSTQVQPDVNKQDSDTNIADKSQQSKNPLDYPDYFNVRHLVKVKDLLNARVHFGHKEGSLDERMKPFLFGSRLGHTIFDLDQTSEMLRTALNVTAHIAFRGGVILFIGQYPQHSLLIEKTARECGEYAHTKYWRIGLFTNSTMMFGAVTRLPDLCIFINTLTTVLDQHFAVSEAAKMLIPTVGIVDSNCNPNLITYPVPGNDDSSVSIELYCRLFKEAILRGKKERQRVFEEYKRNQEEVQN